MGARQLWVAVRRNPLVLLVGVLITACVVVLLGRIPGVYETRALLVLVPPGSRDVPNPLLAADRSLVVTAAALERSVQDGAFFSRTATTDVGLSGLGVRSGYSVRLPPTGNQWVFWYERSVLDVQVVGGSREEVQQSFARTVRKVESELTAMQVDAGVPANRQIVLMTSPSDPPIAYGHGRPRRGQLASLLLGLGMTLSVVFVIDRRRQARRSRSPAGALRHV